VGATFKIYLNPLVNWLWIGSLVFLVGIVIAAWPRPEGSTSRVARHAVVEARHASGAD